jgi:NAD(P)-dependent dehydrogenase (short-subunit alcohol dehydrogenase family)
VGLASLDPPYDLPFPTEELPMNDRLSGRVSLVTGGAAGLGEAICETLAEAGAMVIVADLHADRAEAVAERLRQAGSQAESVTLDVGDAEHIAALIPRVVDHHGQIDILINNAGTDRTVSIEEMAVHDWDCVLRTNLTGPFLLAKAVFPVMRGQGHGQIVNIVSTAAKRAWANASAYHASKWGLLGFSHALHVEGRPHHIKVTAVLAGGMRTGFLLDRFPDIDTGTLQDPRNVAQVVRSVLELPDETVVPEVMVLPMRETSWP